MHRNLCYAVLYDLESVNMIKTNEWIHSNFVSTQDGKKVQFVSQNNSVIVNTTYRVNITV